MNKKYKIGIVGFGDFTKLIIEHLSPYADILVSSRKYDSGDAGLGAKFATNKDVLSQPIIILSIPAQYIGDYIKKYFELINKNAIVLDVCSVKIHPIKDMLELLPQNCSIIGTHPMFGPASVSKNGGLNGLKCVVCRVRSQDDEYNELIDLLGKELGLQVIQKSAEEHDREMAYVQGLSHYIGRVMDIMKIPNSDLSTLAYDDLLDMKKIQGSDSWDLFESIMKQNPYAIEVNNQFKEACNKLDKAIT